jgi:hypothetical protein
LSAKGGPTSSSATDGIALGLLGYSSSSTTPSWRHQQRRTGIIN